MTTLAPQFAAALTNIEVNGKRAKRAQAAHTEVREHLENHETLCSWQVDTILIGSYKRHTGIYPGKDVDVLVKLADLDTSASPKTVYNAVRDVLVDVYGDAKTTDDGRAHEQARSVKIEFPRADGDDNDFSVDAVPAVRDGDRWAIPTKDRGRWAQSTGRWVTTDPEAFAEKITQLNTAIWTPAINGQNALVPIIKLMRQARRNHLGDNKPGGLYIEVATYSEWSTGAVTGDNWAQLFATTLRRVAARLDTARFVPLTDPALSTPLSPAPEDSELEAAATTFTNLADLADEALQLDPCPAAVKWREILGTNDRVGDHVFPLPPGCDANGRAISAVTAVRNSGSNEARGFG